MRLHCRKNAVNAVSMDQQKIIEGLEERAKLSGISISAACIRAGIHPSTFFRWKKTKKNPDPIGATIPNINKLDIALTEMEVEAEQARRAIRARRSKHADKKAVRA